MSTAVETADSSKAKWLMVLALLFSPSLNQNLLKLTFCRWFIDTFNWSECETRQISYRISFSGWLCSIDCVDTPGSLQLCPEGKRWLGWGWGRKDSSEKLIPELKDKDVMARWSGEETAFQAKAWKYEDNPGEI